MMDFPCFQSQRQLHIETEVATEFCSLITEELKKLLELLSEDSISLKWCIEAMEVLKKMQNGLFVLLKSSSLHISFETEDDWFEKYMKETVTLLDFCNSLKYSLLRINRYRMTVDLIVIKLSETKISQAITNFNELEPELTDTSSMEHAAFKSSRNVSEDFSGNRSFHNSTVIVLISAETIMTTLSSLVISALVNPSSFSVKTVELSSQLPELKQCESLLNDLIDCFDAQKISFCNDSRLLLAEHRKVDKIVKDMKAQVLAGYVDKTEDLQSDVEILRRGSSELKEGIDRLDVVIGEVFDGVMRGRNEMLESFREGALIVD